MQAILNTSREASLVPACECEVVARGPNWLIVHIDSIGEGCGLGDRLWRLADQQFTYRIVLEFEPDARPDPRLAAELRSLCDRLQQHGGALRLCGLDPAVARAVLDDAGCPRLHNHADPHDAVWCGPCAERKAPRNSA